MRTVLRSLMWAVSAVLLAVHLVPAAAAGAEAQLAITGEVRGLQVGAPAPLVLTVTNEGAGAAVVTRLTARVTSATAGCAVTSLVVDPWQGRLVVQPGTSAEQRLVARLVRPCPATSFSLAYAAS